MGLVGIGVDVLHTPRILALMRRRSPEQLARRILSQTEWKEWRQKVHSRDLPAQATWLAVRWCLKEAAYKALYPNDKPTWKHLTVEREQNEKPVLCYAPPIPSLGTLATLHCSVSHDGEYVFGMVVAER
ncbi:hypothetical protein PHLGIDRAFT_97620 [Phlebiopsis gigantea 11061_1 CR5-6]|uniref:4'-phosphopantetheinyl transferase domain-containing protein n=1 Tax=Phlebiopsis gigantea (strain 11061_1 CR5-6) TaxID=745531 RepID=A0A0C3S891_PHLG1|nr:hypothetical protein PHLGIDRAFT_97620 [Phlebiopsis gigantea 11061_1 CR5-6]